MTKSAVLPRGVYLFTANYNSEYCLRRPVETTYHIDPIVSATCMCIIMLALAYFFPADGLNVSNLQSGEVNRGS